MFLLSYLAAMTAILLLWFVYPKVFDYSEATQDSLLFMDAMKVSSIGQALTCSPAAGTGTAALTCYTSAVFQLAHHGPCLLQSLQRSAPPCTCWLPSLVTVLCRACLQSPHTACPPDT